MDKIPQNEEVKSTTSSTVEEPEFKLVQTNELRTYLPDGRWLLDEETGRYSSEPDIEYLGREKLKKDFNSITNKTNAAKGLLDLALLMANASQLKYVLVTGREYRFYTAMLSLIIASIVGQILVGVALVFLGRMKWDVHAYDDVHVSTETGKSLTMEDRTRARRHNRRMAGLNDITVVTVLILTVINIFISAFGFDGEDTAKVTNPFQ